MYNVQIYTLNTSEYFTHLFIHIYLTLLSIYTRFPRPYPFSFSSCFTAISVFFCFVFFASWISRGLSCVSPFISTFSLPFSLIPGLSDFPPDHQFLKSDEVFPCITNCYYINVRVDAYLTFKFLSCLFVCTISDVWIILFTDARCSPGWPQALNYLKQKRVTRATAMCQNQY